MAKQDGPLFKGDTDIPTVNVEKLVGCVLPLDFYIERICRIMSLKAAIDRNVPSFNVRVSPFFIFFLTLEVIEQQVIFKGKILWVVFGCFVSFLVCGVIMFFNCRVIA